MIYMDTYREMEEDSLCGIPMRAICSSTFFVTERDRDENLDTT
jgi:hypothetical protein